MSYGVISTGYSRKPLTVILQELEDAMIATFGPAVIQSAQSPLGQINGLMANLSAQSWELGEDIYQASDPDVAEGARLDVLAKIRGVERPNGEGDVAFRRRVTNEGRRDTSARDLMATVAAVDGVTCSGVIINRSGLANSDCIPPHSIAVWAIGGDDAEIAAAILTEAVPGIGLYGNTLVEAIDAAGVCRSVQFIRPVAVPITLQVALALNPKICGCRPPSAAEVRDVLTTALACGEECGFAAALPVTESMIRRPLASISGAEVLSISGGRDGAAAGPLPIQIGCFEIASLDPDDITVVYQ